MVDGKIPSIFPPEAREKNLNSQDHANRAPIIADHPMSLVASIIIRTKNEERWIASCLLKVLEQTVRDVEVILVDNESSDKTIQRARSVMPEIGVVSTRDFFPGKALNEGIRKASGKYIVCLSSHCVPKQNDWLENLLSNFDGNSRLAGVYGRQIPMHFTSDHDKRDLVVSFGLDKRIQYKDPFFHNANSVIPHKIWSQHSFDESVTNIEDRIWARKVLSEGYYIIYEPDAPVYHYHGIHHDRNSERARNVTRIMGQEVHVSRLDETNPFLPSKLNIGIIIPVREEPELSSRAQDKLLEMTIASARESKLIDRPIVSTNSHRVRQVALRLGAEAPFIRPDELAAESAYVVDVLKHALEWYEDRDTYFDYLVALEITHPFRTHGLVDQCIEKALETGLDTIVAGVPEYRPCWWWHDDEYRRLDDFIQKRSAREPIQIGLPALCTVALPSTVRGRRRLDARVGIVDINNPLAALEIRDDAAFDKLAPLLFQQSKMAIPS